MQNRAHSPSVKSNSGSLSYISKVKSGHLQMSPDTKVHKKLLIEKLNPVGYNQLDHMIVRDIKRGMHPSNFSQYFGGQMIKPNPKC